MSKILACVIFKLRKKKLVPSAGSSQYAWSIQISITNQGDPGENAIAERINRTIKEAFDCRAFLTFEQASAAIAKSILIFLSYIHHSFLQG